MAEMPRRRSEVFGVDFSGARDAGKKIWVARGAIDGERLRIEDVRRGDQLRDSGRPRDRCLAALRRCVAEHPEAVFGLDFPFGLPLVVTDQLFRAERWSDFLASFVGRYGGGRRAAEQFKLDCWEAAGNKEAKRATDKALKTPFSPYNLWLFRQTHYGILEVLAPLVAGGLASVLPMQPARPDRPWLLEVCPASTLQRLGIYGRSYKRKTAADRNAREGILERLKAGGAVWFPKPQLEQVVLDDHHGDALDSVIAAFAVFSALQDAAFPLASVGEDSQVEGRIYA